MKIYDFTATPYATQHGTITVPDDVVVTEDYIRDHWNEVKLDEPELDYRGTDLTDITESED